MAGKKLIALTFASLALQACGLLAAPMPQAEHSEEPEQVTVVVAQEPAAIRLGFDGYCPIALSEMHCWIKGEDHWTVDYQGQRFHFASEAARDKFLAKPMLYAPSHRGFDVVLQRDHELLRPGKRRHGIVHSGRIYLFESEETLAIFCKSPQRYSSDAK